MLGKVEWPQGAWLRFPTPAGAAWGFSVNIMPTNCPSRPSHTPQRYLPCPGLHTGAHGVHPRMLTASREGCLNTDFVNEERADWTFFSWGGIPPHLLLLSFHTQLKFRG